MAKGRKTGGRQKGTPNRATAAKAEAIASSGLTPLDYMLCILRDNTQPVEYRFEAAKAAAPYVHPRLAAVQVGGDADNPVALEVVKRVIVDPDRTGNPDS